MERQKELAEMFARFTKDLLDQMAQINPLGTMYEENIANQLTLQIKDIDDRAFVNLNSVNYRYYLKLAYPKA